MSATKDLKRPAPHSPQPGPAQCPWLGIFQPLTRPQDDTESVARDPSLPLVVQDDMNHCVGLSSLCRPECNEGPQATGTQ
jgi:hypothetical protein